jgi:protein-S-isoprenylcysteine O-methyltransferase Ste14
MTAGAPPDHAQVAFPPPVGLLLALGLGFLGQWWIPLPFLPQGISRAAGTTLLGGALLLFVWAVWTLLSKGAEIRTHRPSDRIVTTGPYRFSRNPIYLAMVLLTTGAAVRANSLWFLVTAAVLALLLHRGVVLREERYLERRLSAPYLEYKRRVRRWI